ATGRRMPAVRAAWERPPAGWHEEVRSARVAIPQIMGWGLAEFDRSRSVEAAGIGAVIAVDYLQLIDHSGDDAAAAAALAWRARSRRWRLFVGVMAPRQLVELGGDIAPVRATLM